MRWLGVGLSTVMSVVTVALTVTGRLHLYINPAQAWFACGMAVLLLLGAIASFALPLGDEEDHGHAEHEHHRGAPARGTFVATVAGGVIASAVAISALILPPATLSAEVAMDRDSGTAPLFAGADEIQLGLVDTSGFGVGDWSAVFSTATSPERYEGENVRLTGFVTPGMNGSLNLNRLVITHCVIDAQTAALPLADADAIQGLETGEWIEMTGAITVNSAGGLVITPASIDRVDEPEDPYEY